MERANFLEKEGGNGYFVDGLSGREPVMKSGYNETLDLRHAQSQ